MSRVQSWSLCPQCNFNFYSDKSSIKLCVYCIDPSMHNPYKKIPQAHPPKKTIEEYINEDKKRQKDGCCKRMFKLDF
jgi:hypothetical protein